MAKFSHSMKCAVNLRIDMDLEQLEEIKNYAIELIVQYTPKLLLAILTLVVGLWIIRKLIRITRRTMERRSVDPSLIPFATSLINIGLKVLLLVSVAGMVGIATTSFIAVLGAAGLAVGLALQGSLSNFAGGVLILAFKPFKVGDLIEAQGEIGVVDKITVLNTLLSLPTGDIAILPNGMVANDKVVNFTKMPIRRVDLIIGISYKADIDKAKAVIMDSLRTMTKVLEEPAPFVGVKGLGESSVDLAVRPYAKSEEYWDVYFEAYEVLKKALDANEIEIPFPQRDLHVKTGKV